MTLQEASMLRRPILWSFLMLVTLSVCHGAALAGEVAASPEQVHPLLIGSEIPELTLTAADGKTVDLRRLTSEQRTILIFYRGGW